MIIEYVGVKEINGSLVVIDGVKGASYEEIVDNRFQVRVPSPFSPAHIRQLLPERPSLHFHKARTGGEGHEQVVENSLCMFSIIQPERQGDQGRHRRTRPAAEHGS